MRAFTASDQLSAHSFKIVSFISLQNIMLSFPSELGCSTTKKQSILKGKPSSDDRNTGLSLFDVLGNGFSWWVLFAILCRLLSQYLRQHS